MAELTANALEALEKRYFIKDKKGKPENFTGMCTRVAAFTASVEKEDKEKWAKDFFEMMYNLQFLPNSPTLMNAGTDAPMCSACFVLPVHDDIQSIFDEMKHAAMIHKLGGGTGFSFTELRREGAMVGKRNGVASGPISFMEIYDKATGTMKQGGTRRGANMGILRVDHEDILKFIDVKSDPNKLNNFNLSIAFTDKFMKSVIKGKSEALEVWNKFIKRSWEAGEPGAFFIDTAQKANPIPKTETIIATNPCVMETTLVDTPNGQVPVESLKVGDLVSTLHPKGYEPIDSIEVHEDTPVFEVTFSDGGVQWVTAAHRYHAITKIEKPSGATFSKNIMRKRLDELKIGDKIQVKPVEMVGDIDYEHEHYCLGQAIGILVGDGSYSEDQGLKNEFRVSSNSEEAVYNSKLIELFVQLGSKLKNSYTGENSKSITFTFEDNGLIEMLRLKRAYSEAKELPTNVFNNKNMLCGVISGLLMSDGNVNLTANYPQIRHKTCSGILAGQIRNALISLGIHGRAYWSFFDDGGVIGGRKIHREHPIYEIVIGGSDCIQYGKVVYNCFHDIKLAKLKKIIYSNNCTGDVRYAEIIGINKFKNAKVYDLHCKESDTWITSGYVQQGCGEVPMGPYNACILGSINLSKCVKTGKKGLEIDWTLLERLTYLGVRFLDNIIDAQCYPLPEIEEMVKKTRKIGLGIMGWADLLIILGIKYDTLKAVKLAERVMGFINDTAHKASIELGKQRGIPEACEVHGLNYRNATCTCIAPTGTLSIIAGCSSSGEPIFMLAGHTNRLETQQEYSHPLAAEFKQKYPDKQLPDYFVIANDISPDWHVKMQAAFQRHTDLAVSKTINFDNRASEEDISKAFLLAYKMGCKGLTVYRDGSRTNQVLNGLKKAKENGELKEFSYTETIAPKLPPMLQGERHKIKISVPLENQESEIIKGYIGVNFWPESKIPCEILYTMKSKYLEIMLAKQPIVSQLLEIVMTGTSKMLAHKVPLRYVIKWLEDLPNQWMFSIPAQVAKILKNYLGEVNKTLDAEGKDIPCPIEGCTGKIIYESGCWHCDKCGYSEKCS